MWNKPTEKQLSKVPVLYATEGVSLADKKIVMHFFFGDCDWYIVEYDGEDTFFCYAILNGDLEMAEWGYTSYTELKDLKVRGCEVDRDMYWGVRKACEVDNIQCNIGV